MKKTILSLFALCLCLVVEAQTNFRHVTFNEAKAAAKAEQKLLFMDFYTDWCGPCKMMANTIFPQKEVGDYLNPRLVCIKVDAEKGEGVELAKQFKIKAYPTFIITDAEGVEKGRFVGGRDIDGLRSEIERITVPGNSPEQLKARYNSGERTPELIANYTALIIDEGRNSRKKEAYMKANEEANRIAQDYFAGLSEADRFKAENIFVYRKFSETPEEPSAKFMIENIDRFPADMKADIDTIVKKLYFNTIASYIGGRLPFNADNYKAAKQNIKRLGLNADKSYDEPFRFLDELQKGDLSRFIDFCSSNIGKLDSRMRTTLMFGMDKLIPSDQPDLRKKASRFLRSQLADMDAGDIMFVAYTIRDLEGGGKH
ncbi:MAG: thioredoxin family protein [Prevotella sp.]